MYIRRVKTASGATAVQLVEKRRGVRKIVEHLGSAHDEVTLAALEQVAREKIQAGQMAFDLDLHTDDTTKVPATGVDAGGGLVLHGTRPRLLWEVLELAYERIGFPSAVDDEVFKQLVLARIIEPTSKLDSLRVLEELNVGKVPSYATLKRRLARSVEEKWQDAVSAAAYRFAAGGGAVSLCLYDVTTLYFEADEEDELRKSGFSKERRIDPQILVGLLVDRSGFPLELHFFEGNKAETRTMIPVLDAFRDRHQVEDMLVVADAGMLSWANIQALEEAGYQYIVGSRNSKAPMDLAKTFATKGNHFADGQVIETTTELKKGTESSRRRAVWQYRLAREHRDRRNHTLQVQRAEDIAAGRKAQRKARFLTNGQRKSLSVDYEAAKTAEQLFGLKGYVTNTSMKVLSGAEVVAAYHSLFEVEASFRMAKSDLRARPIFHHTRDAIQAHLTIVFCALAVARHLQMATGLSLRRIIKSLQPLREGLVEINGTIATIPAALTPEAKDILNSLSQSGH
ncbi:IS1634 family transposase [Streptomyces rishiriensis]|uniref:IS1634 family transposase n=1 Tax=Streptomyces rishiriensis TaxID=68264 RepID=UPI0037A47EDD